MARTAIQELREQYRQVNEKLTDVTKSKDALRIQLEKCRRDYQELATRKDRIAEKANSLRDSLVAREKLLFHMGEYAHILHDRLTRSVKGNGDD